MYFLPENQSSHKYKKYNDCIAATRFGNNTKAMTDWDRFLGSQGVKMGNRFSHKQRNNKRKTTKVYSQWTLLEIHILGKRSVPCLLRKGIYANNLLLVLMREKSQITELNGFCCLTSRNRMKRNPSALNAQL